MTPNMLQKTAWVGTLEQNHEIV